MFPLLLFKKFVFFKCITLKLYMGQHVYMYIFLNKQAVITQWSHKLKKRYFPQLSFELHQMNPTYRYKNAAFQNT